MKQFKNFLCWIHGIKGYKQILKGGQYVYINEIKDKMETDTYFDIKKLNEQFFKVDWVRELLIYHINQANWDNVIMIAEALKKSANDPKA